MILLTKSMIKFEEKTNILVFIAKMKGPREFVRYNEEFVKNYAC